MKISLPACFKAWSLIGFFSWMHIPTYFEKWRQAQGCELTDRYVDGLGEPLLYLSYLFIGVLLYTLSIFSFYSFWVKKYDIRAWRCSNLITFVSRVWLFIFWVTWWTLFRLLGIFLSVFFLPEIQDYLLSHAAVDLVHKDGPFLLSELGAWIVDGYFDDNGTSSWLSDLELRCSKSAKPLADPDPQEWWRGVGHTFLR